MDAADLITTGEAPGLLGCSRQHIVDLCDAGRAALDSGPDQVLAILISDTPQAADLRQNSPFTRILPEDERRKVLRSFRGHWRAEHSHDT